MADERDLIEAKAVLLVVPEQTDEDAVQPVPHSTSSATEKQ